MQSSLRALFFALALVVQTIAGGAPASASAPISGHAHCEQMRGAAAGKADSEHKGAPPSHDGGCEHCLLCDLGFGVAVDASAPTIVLNHRWVRFLLAPTTRQRATVAQGAFARGPPSA